MNYKIENTLLTELDYVSNLYDDAIRFQQENGHPAWLGFDKNVIADDIKSSNHYKAIFNGEIAIVFSVCYSDKIIWRHMEKGDAVYLHRIVVNPTFRGQKLFATIVDWAIRHAKAKGFRFIRMDTWAVNTALADYYKTFGFYFVEYFTTPDSADLPSQNRNLKITLLELQV